MSPAKALAAALLAGALAAARAQPALPSLAAMEAEGAVIGEIYVRPQNIFNLDDPRENNRLFRLANRLHVSSRPETIRRSLLFRSGEPLSVRRIRESERLLLSNRYLYEAQIRPVAYRDGVVDLEVLTRDTWSLKPEVSVSREGGVTTGSLSIEEENLLGTGMRASITRRREVDDSGTELALRDRHFFGAWTGVDYAFRDLDTGEAHAFAVERPFYALDVRSAARFAVSHDSRIDSVYRAGEVVGEYRHVADGLEASGGWSTGLVDGWTHRLTGGISYQMHDYALEPDRAAPEALPEDVTLAGPFLRYQLIEDDVRRLRNFDLIERPEFFSLGLAVSVQLGRALAGWDSTRDATLYSFGLSDGYFHDDGHMLLASVAVSGRRDALAHRRYLSASARYYRRQSPHSLFFVSLSGAVTRNPDISAVLQVGGDSGLRGFPLRYQTGNQRVVLTLEQRLYTDWYPFRLFRIGGAIFYDVGRAKGGPFGQGDANPGWLSNIGVGLRILSTRSAFGNVLHADLAFPLQTGPGIDTVQFSFKTRTSF